MLIFTAEGIDYEALDVELMFEKCMRRKCVNIIIMEDQINELDKSFTFHLNRTTDLSSLIIFDQVDGEIHIIDDGKQQLSMKYRIMCGSNLQKYNVI